MIDNGWINVNPTGGYIGPHYHPGAFWSGSYYIQVPDDTEGNGGAIEFLSPHKPLPSLGFLKSPITADKFRFRPTPGTVLIFPRPSITHWVHPNDSEEGPHNDRVQWQVSGQARRQRGQSPPIRIATSFMKRTSSPPASHSASAAIAESTWQRDWAK